MTALTAVERAALPSQRKLRLSSHDLLPGSSLRIVLMLAESLRLQPGSSVPCCDLDAICSSHSDVEAHKPDRQRVSTGCQVPRARREDDGGVRRQAEGAAAGDAADVLRAVPAGCGAPPPGVLRCTGRRNTASGSEQMNLPARESEPHSPPIAIVSAVRAY